MSEQAIKYLRENKGKYPAEDLAKTLREAGYDSEDVRMSINEVFFDGERPKYPQVSLEDQSFWDISDTKIYVSASQKWLDFLCGVFVPGFVFWTFNLIVQNFNPYFYFGDAWGLFYLAEFALLVYFWNRRRFIRWGIFAQILVYPMVLFLGLRLFFSF